MMNSGKMGEKLFRHAATLQNKLEVKTSLMKNGQELKHRRSIFKCGSLRGSDDGSTILKTAERMAFLFPSGLAPEKREENIIEHLKSHNLDVNCRNYSSLPRRALMYVPGDDPKKINKSFTLDVDCIALDCEDGVAINRKVDARETIRTFLDKGKPSKPREYDLGVRINAFNTTYWQEDLKSCLTAQHLPDTVLVPKVETVDAIELFSNEVSKHLKPNSKINLIIYIESAKAYLNLVNICKTAEDLSKNGKFTPVSLVFGSDDFMANIGATRTEDSIEVLYARQKLVLVAKAFNLQAIDMVYIKYKDLDGLKTQCEQGMRMGFTGKQVIHPGQVPVVQQAFLPTASQIEWATGLLKSFKEHQKEGKGAFTYKGSMVDMPTMKQAENIVKLANLKVA